MRPLLILIGIGFLFGNAILGQDAATTAGTTNDSLASIHIPKGLRAPDTAKPIVVAVIDDGVRLSHQELRPFIWHNPREIPGNRVDDDGNGRVDDTTGWDVADEDGNVSPPTGREEMFYHGTHLAGIVARIARVVYGDEAPRRIKILPVKCLADNADKPYLKDGYKGIQYAVDQKADVILVAWGVPQVSPTELRILQAAQERGSLVVASAGNFPEEREQYPAAFPPVLSVSAVDYAGAKLHQANYGSFVDLVALGARIFSASNASDTAEEARDGTSVAAAMVAAASAVIKVQHPAATPDEIVARLKNTAEPVEQFQSGDILYAGKLGAGRLNLSRAAAFSLSGEPATPNNHLQNHQGYLAIYRPEKQLALWRIRPEGDVSGFWFEVKRREGDPGASRLKLYQGGTVEGAPFLDLKLTDWNERRFVPGRQVMALYEPDTNQPNSKVLVEYATQPINQSSLYCRDTVQVKAEGILEDGSGPENYSPNSACKWLVTAPVGKVIQIQFLEFDTEPNTDWVYFFNGSGTHEKIMAVFSGPKIPPELTTWRNQALIWFVTNEQGQAQGWKARVTFVDPPKAIAPAAAPALKSGSEASPPSP